MRALQFTRYGSPEVLSWGDAPEPHAGPRQIGGAASRSAPPVPRVQARRRRYGCGSVRSLTHSRVGMARTDRRPHSAIRPPHRLPKRRRADAHVMPQPTDARPRCHLRATRPPVEPRAARRALPPGHQTVASGCPGATSKTPTVDQSRFWPPPSPTARASASPCTSSTSCHHHARGELAQQLLDTIDNSATAALHLCHRALELDGRAYDHTADEWLPAVYRIGAPLLEHARLHREPPLAVEHAQDAIRWLASAIINLDPDPPDAPAAIADGLGRLLALCVFADVARSRADALPQ